MACPTVICGSTVMGVSNRVSASLTRRMDRHTKGTGMSWGSTAIPPRRATVSAIRRPEMAVMLATTIGNGVARPSVEARSTFILDPTDDLLGAMKTSL